MDDHQADPGDEMPVLRPERGVLVSNLTVITTTGVNLREKGLNNAPIRAVLDKGAQAEVLGNAGSWLQLRSGDQIGFAYMGNTQPREAPGAGWPTYVTSPELNVRDAPSSPTILGTIKNGEQAAVIGFTGDWLRISYNGRVGFIKADYTSSVLQTGAAIDPASFKTLTMNTGAQQVAGPIKARLASEEIAQLRTLISQASDARAREDRFEELQSRVIYASQRDNQVRDRNGAKIESVAGNMCNLTALSMALSYLGFPNPRPQMQYEDALEAIRQERGLPPRHTSEGWSGVAQAVGAQAKIIASGIKEGRDWWEINVRQAHLRQGSGIIMSIGGHIVRVQAVTEQGLVVDDPYGYCKLLPWEDNPRVDRMREPAVAYKPLPYRTNEYGKTGETAGEDALWPWAEVAAHRMRWIAAVIPAPAVLGDEEPIEHFEDNPAIPDEAV
jgi:uncharacterized protein YgiM (DUF1202 family)